MVQLINFSELRFDRGPLFQFPSMPDLSGITPEMADMVPDLSGITPEMA